MRLNVQADTREAMAFLRTLDEGTQERVLPRALNRTLTQLRTTATKEITARRALKAAEVRNKISLHKATRRKPEAWLSVSRAALSIRLFSTAGKRGVTARVVKGSKRVLLRRGNRKAFLMTKGRAAHTIMVRTGKPSPSNPKREGLMKWPAVAGLGWVLTQTKTVAALNKVARDVFMRRLRHEAEREIEMAKRKSMRGA
jgi:hypothetical protein